MCSVYPPPHTHTHTPHQHQQKKYFKDTNYPGPEFSPQSFLNVHFLVPTIN